MPEARLSPADRVALRDELAKLYSSQDRMYDLLADIGYSTAGLPWGQPLRTLWTTVIDDLIHGADPGLVFLVEFVLTPGPNRYPRNEVLRRIAGLLTGAEVQESVKILRTIYRTDDVQAIVAAAGLDPANINFIQPADDVWLEVFEHADHRGQVDALLDAAAAFHPALRRALDEARGTAPGSAAPAPQIPGLILAEEAPRWKNVPGAETVIDEGAPTFVDIVFFATGLDRARGVCRLAPWFSGRRIGSGTGFRVGPDLILTSHHVLFDWAEGDRRPLSVEAWFNYEVDDQGQPTMRTEIPCDPASIVGERDQDWAVIRTREPIPDAFPPLRLGGARVPVVGDRVAIIQHPQRLPKKVAFQHNLIRAVEPDRILYWTDTDKGSSGSPVFDEDWSVVALHHWTIAAPKGERSKWWNQGRRIDWLVGRMKANGVDLPGG
jgi:hypothetical protein